VISYYSLRELCGVLNVTWQLSREGQHVDPSPDIYTWTLALLTQLINILTVPEDGPSRAETFWECNGVNEMLLTYVIALVEILHKIVASERGYEQDILCELIESRRFLIGVSSMFLEPIRQTHL
jgi:hypothetical protein